jgi:hypothetical protein
MQKRQMGCRAHPRIRVYERTGLQVALMSQPPSLAEH